MKYVSTRGKAPDLNFEEAMLTGLARDGGLYVPEIYPTLSSQQISSFSTKSYEEVAFEIMKPFVGDTFSDDEFKRIIKSAYAGFSHKAKCPMVQLSENHFLLELFHGPTLAFKDFKGLASVDLFIMYPHGRVSEVQRRQMTTPKEANVHALAVDGDFDTCQALLKDMFNDFDFRDDVRLAGVNSINWARVLAQVVYYFTSAVALGAPNRKISFSVPTGNFGDIFAGYVAKRMGLPIDRLIIATNQNDILHRTVKTGSHTKSGVKPSISPSMDIQVSSNFERLIFDLYNRDGDKVSELFDALKSKGTFTLSIEANKKLNDEFDSGCCSDIETSQAIKKYYNSMGEILCPHSAIGVSVSEEHMNETPIITLATAHPAKFPDAVEKACGIIPNLPPHMADLYVRDERMTRVSGDLNALEAIIRKGIK